VPETALPEVDLDESALFLDFDGTLVDIADRPDEIVVADGTIEMLAALDRRLGSALAIVSGREIEDLDRYLAPLKLCAAGVHGLVRRDAEGFVHLVDLDRPALARFRAHLEARIAGYAGLLMEEKTGALALHYRARPDLAEVCAATVASALDATGAPGLAVMHGKMVIETRLAHNDKGTAIAAFMMEPPFSGRRPVFAGDDVTDEDGFSRVDRLGGTAIKVGEGATRAPFRIKSPAALRAWLSRLAGLETGAGGLT
jgi:trehalose 6-phosphate phosphatase